MNQDDLRATLHAIIEERAKAGESLADVGATLAKLTDPPSKPPSRQYIQMLVAGKANITERYARAILTLAAMQDDATGLQASAHLVTTPIYALPANAIITDPAPPADWTAVAWRSSAGAPTADRITAPKPPADDAPTNQNAHPKTRPPMPDNDHRIHRTSSGTRQNGRSTQWVLCPYCGTWTECYIWSLAGRGKRCACGALHHWLNNETKAPKNHKAPEEP